MFLDLSILFSKRGYFFVPSFRIIRKIYLSLTRQKMKGKSQMNITAKRALAILMLLSFIITFTSSVIATEAGIPSPTLTTEIPFDSANTAETETDISNSESSSHLETSADNGASFEPETSSQPESTSSTSDESSNDMTFEPAGASNRDIMNTSEIHVTDEATFVEAVLSIESTGTIITNNDISFSGTITIPPDKSILITSNEGNTYTITATGSYRHFSVSGNLAVENIILHGNDIGGGIFASGGSVSLNQGSIITHCYALLGGGVFIDENASLLINGGTISANSTGVNGERGGGIFIKNSTAVMLNGIIENNTSPWGGGIAVGMNSTFTMEDGIIRGNEATSESGGGVHVYVFGTFIMNGGYITNNTANISESTYGGGVFVGQGIHVLGEDSTWCKFIFNGGTISYNSAHTGGGIAARQNGQITMNSGTISNNQAFSGGGISLTSSSVSNSCVIFIMKSGEITENLATTHFGGGIWARNDDPHSPMLIVIGSAEDTSDIPIIQDNYSALAGGGIMFHEGTGDAHIGAHIYNAEICNNTSDGSGGGIYTYMDVPLFIIGATIRNNHATINGGGIFTSGPTTHINETTITNNTAQNGAGIYVATSGAISVTNSLLKQNSASLNGGGIFTENYSYQNPVDTDAYTNITLDQNTSFIGNNASSAHFSPTNSSSFSHIDFAQSSIPSGANAWIHPLNNYDINYVNTELTFHSITYNSNGGTGSHVDQNLVFNFTYTALDTNSTGISRVGYTFANWNTLPNGNGTEYLPSTAILIVEDLELYAQWTRNEYTVTYTDGVDDAEIFADQQTTGLFYGSETPAFVGMPTREGYTFTGWNPTIDETVSDNATYTAQWTRDEYTVTYIDGADGSVFSSFLMRNFSYGDSTPPFPFSSALIRNGYTFTGWNPTIEETVTGDAVYTAQWTKSALDIPYPPSAFDETSPTPLLPSYVIPSSSPSLHPDSNEVFTPTHTQTNARFKSYFHLAFDNFTQKRCCILSILLLLFAFICTILYLGARKKEKK